MKRIIKRLFCKHDVKFARNIYGDEIVISGYKRSVWKCAKCSKVILKESLVFGPITGRPL